MKYLCVIVPIILLIVDISGEVPKNDAPKTSEQIYNKSLYDSLVVAIGEMANQCKDKYNNGTSYTRADIESMIGKETSISGVVKCLQACILKSTSFMNDSNKLNEEYSAEFMKSTLGIESEVSKEVFEICNRKTAEKDECESAYKLSICVKNELMNKNIDIHSF